MKHLENYLKNRMRDRKIMYVDLANIEVKPYGVELNLGVKEAHKEVNKPYWNALVIGAEVGFTVDDFKKVCEDLKIKYSVDLGEDVPTWKCDNCRKMYGAEEEQFNCHMCGAYVCYSCISDDINICKECEE